jgi:hypothetical protein
VPASDCCRKRWSVEEANLLTDVFPGHHLELIEGDLFSKAGQKPPHVYLVRMLAAALAGAVGPDRVQVQSSIKLPGQPHSEPAPDVIVLHGAGRELFDRLAGPEDIALLIEVADASFSMDREVKYRLYARGYQ